MIYGDIDQESSQPLSLTFVFKLVNLIHEIWTQPAAPLPISRHTENLYRIHGDDTNYISKHPAPNSVIVHANSSKASGRHVTPVNREGRKLDVLGRKMYGFQTCLLRICNYQAAMGAYHKHLCTKILPALQGAPEDTRQEFLNAYAEAMTLSRHQHLAARHATEAAAKTLVSTITLCWHTSVSYTHLTLPTKA